MISGVGVGKGLAAVRGYQFGVAWSASWNIIIHTKLEFWIAGMGRKGGFWRF